MVGVSAIKRTAAKSAKASVERQIAEIQDIEQIYNDYLTAQAQYNEMLTFYDSTKISNEYMREFWDTLEEKLPTNINVTSFSSSSGAISLAMESTDYDSIARLVVELRDIDCMSMLLHVIIFCQSMKAPQRKQQLRL
jgi:hypothetical protein